MSSIEFLTQGRRDGYREGYGDVFLTAILRSSL